MSDGTSHGPFGRIFFRTDRGSRGLRLGGFLDGHRPGLDCFAGGPARRQAGGQQAGGRQGGVDVADVLAALDELERPLEDRASARARPAGSAIVS